MPLNSPLNSLLDMVCVHLEMRNDQVGCHTTPKLSKVIKPEEARAYAAPGHCILRFALGPDSSLDLIAGRDCAVSGMWTCEPVGSDDGGIGTFSTSMLTGVI